MTTDEQKEKLVNDISLEVIAKSIFNETNSIGFSTSDYVKLVNLLLDKTIVSNNSVKTNGEEANPFVKTKTSNLPLKGEKIMVRKFIPESDNEIFRKWMEDENGRYFLLTRTTLRNYTIDKLVNSPNDKLGMITLPDKTPVGLMAFLDFDDEQKKAELRKMIGDPQYRGRGFGKEASKLWIQYGVQKLGLRKIYLNTLDTNARNIRINKELGFRVEGILRDECLIDGKFYDVLRMGLVV